MAAKPVQSIPLCSVRGCPAPSSPEYHVPFCGHGLEGQHHHTKKRSQGGTDSFQVFICPACHDAIDNKHTLEDEVYYLPAVEQWRYAIWKTKGLYQVAEYICDKVIDPPFWEDGYAEVQPREADNGVLPEVHEREPDEGPRRESVAGDVEASSLTFSEWAEKCKSIGTFRHSLGFLIGDLVILGEDAFGEKAWQYLSDLGYEDRSIGNMVRVCRKVPLDERSGMPFSFEVVTANLPLGERREWLSQAKEEGWTVRQLREAVNGPPKPRVKRYSIEELRARSIEDDAPIKILAFLDWLEAQDD